MLRHRTTNSPICLSEEIHKPFALSQILLLFSGGKSVLLVKGKAPSRSGILLSMHVVLKTRHVNPNIHVRRFIVHVRSPNLFATRPQLFIPTRSNNLIEVTSQSYIALPTHLYWSLSEAILVGDVTYIGRPADPYRFTHPPSSGRRRSSPKRRDVIGRKGASSAGFREV